jgi:cytoskeletal protein RodZ
MATGIGETLRTARRQQGVALSDAVAQTRVRESYLTALEEENFAVLGGHVYAKGFLRSYARFLGLDPEPLVEAYRAEHEQADDLVSLAQRRPAVAMRSQRPPGLIIGLGVVALVIVTLFIIGLGANGRPGSDVVLRGAPEPVRTSEPAQAAARSPTGRSERPRTQHARPRERTGPRQEPNRESNREPTGVPVPNTDPTEQVSGDGVDLELASTGGDSWMRVTVDGVEQFEGVQPQGETESYSGQSITVRIGDAGVVEVTVNGEERGHLGDRRQVVDKTYTVTGSA